MYTKHIQKEEFESLQPIKGFCNKFKFSKSFED